jgi:restriction endonuclease S subunit
MITRENVTGTYPVKPLGEVAEFLDNMRRPIKESDRKPGPYPYYGANGQQGTIDGFLFDEPLILLAEDGGFFDAPERGIAYRISGKSWVNNHAHIIKPKNGLDLSFLCRVLENYDVTPFISGTTRAKLTKGQAEKIEIPLPPLDEQKRIAAILDQANELRRKRRLGFGRLDALTRSIFVNLFGDPTTDTGQWPQTTLERFFGFQTGKLDSNAAVPNGQFPFFTCAKEDFRIDTYAFDCEALLLAGNNANADYSVKHYKGKFNAYQRTYVLTLRNEKNSYQYARFALEYRLAELKRISKGTNTKYLTLELLNNLHIPLPPPELQSKFADLSAGIESVKAAYSNHLRKLDTLFISLQHRAFSGELTSRDVERELAIAG